MGIVEGAGIGKGAGKGAGTGKGAAKGAGSLNDEGMVVGLYIGGRDNGGAPDSEEEEDNSK